MEKVEKLRAIVWRERDVFVSQLEGTDIASQGDTPEEAFKNLKEATELYLEDMPEDEKREMIKYAKTCGEEALRTIEVSTS